MDCFFAQTCKLCVFPQTGKKEQNIDLREKRRRIAKECGVVQAQRVMRQLPLAFLLSCNSTHETSRSNMQGPSCADQQETPSYSGVNSRTCQGVCRRLWLIYYHPLSMGGHDAWQVALPR